MLVKQLTPTDSQWSPDTFQVLNYEQYHQNDNIDRPHSVTAASTGQNENAEEHAIDHRVQIQTNDHRDNSHNETYLHSSSQITTHKYKATTQQGNTARCWIAVNDHTLWVIPAQSVSITREIWWVPTTQHLILTFYC